jgi:prophage maintenance system killer protein
MIKTTSKLLATKPLIYQAKDGEIELNADIKNQNIWASQAQIVEIFKIDQSVASRHINNIFKDNEIDKKSNMQKMHIANSDKPVAFYSLDVILAVGYRTNSKTAIDFRKWATKILKGYLFEGVAINKKLISQNYQKFSQALKNIKAILPKDNHTATENILDLISDFAQTWLSLNAYDKNQLENKGSTTRKIKLDVKELELGIASLKITLLKNNEATEIFAKERNLGSLEGIIGNIMQSFDGEEVYQTLEEKAGHLLYFIVKNHPFIDGNKRCGAFAFIWFLQRNNLLNQNKISPQALTALTLLIAESNPKEKAKIINLILTLLKKTK